MELSELEIKNHSVELYGINEIDQEYERDRAIDVGLSGLSHQNINLIGRNAYQHPISQSALALKDMTPMDEALYQDI